VFQDTLPTKLAGGSSPHLSQVIAVRVQAEFCCFSKTFFLQKIVQPALYAKLSTLEPNGYQLRMCVGIASGEAVIARAGVRGRSDLVSIGRAPNVAAKLSDIREAGTYRTYITEAVYKRLDEGAKFAEGVDMWEALSAKVGGEQMTIYRSSYRWSC